MHNVVFVDLNKDIVNTSKLLFDRNKFSLKYLNKFCGYYVPRKNNKVNIWITVGIHNQHNLMVYAKMDKAFLVLSGSNTDTDFWNNLKISYNQLKKVSKNISMISIGIEKIALKRSLLQWCIEHDNMQYIELSKTSLDIDNL